ncbi:SUMF1/EgtB/PvdO family nonheme iron enzyme, partial [bacterium]|nr:SUMF1/EgtB/PvdO family nonheme iron enzyme [bacterium]
VGEPIITHPSVFQLEAREAKVPVSRTEHGLRLSGAQNQLTETVMVMDYSLSMADIPANGDENSNGISDAIEAMEAAAKTLIDALNAGARVGAYEFHREEEPNRVFPFVTDKQYAKEQIDSIMDNYIHDFHDLSRVWDAVYAAVHEFDEWATNKENRVVVFFSDGRDESSTKRREDIIQAANNRNVTVYAIGFGGEVNETPLKNITAQTGGRYFAAREKNAFLTHIQQIQHDLQGYYTIRWATLKRNDESFTPSFTISLNNLSDTAAAPKNAYNVKENAGDPLVGRLQFVGSNIVKQNTTIYLRADYVPRSVRRIKLHFHSDYPYTASLVSAASGGLVSDWGMQITQAESSGAQWIEIVSPDPTDRLTSIPFAAFGSLIRFDFTHIPPNIGVEEILGTNRDVYVDNTIYENTGGQSFVINNIPGVSTVRVPLDLPTDAQPLELIRIPAGTFTMGSPQSEKDRQNDEGPPHPVKISQQFYLGKYEITQAQWKAVMGYNPSANGDKPNFPVETISWEDTQDFLQELNKLNLGYFRLPTEAEWEYACRADSTARFHFGDDAFYSRINSHAWNRQNAGEESHEVGFKSPNAWNLFDMTGNVWEWCKDWKDAYTAAKQIDPTGPASGSAKVIRGGAFDYHPKYCRSAARNGFNPKLRFPNTGFRVLMEKR